MSYALCPHTYDLRLNTVLLSAQDRLVERYLIVAGKEWTPSQCDIAYKVLKKVVSSFLALVLGADGGDAEVGTEYLTACRGGKLSFHVIADCLKLERGYLSCRYLAWEMSRFFWAWMNNFLWAQRACLDRWSTGYDVMLRLSMLHKQADGAMEWFGMNDTWIDEVIYTRNRQLRLVGNAKLGGVPLWWMGESGQPSEAMAMASAETFVNGKYILWL
jgi:hypothetical protein